MSASNLPKPRIPASVPPSEATEVSRGIGSIVPASKTTEMLAALQQTGLFNAASTSEFVNIATLANALEFLLNNNVPFRAAVSFPNGIFPGVGNGKIAITDGLGKLTGLDSLPVGKVNGAAVAFPELNVRGNYAISASPASYPMPVAANAVGATQTGNGSGAGNSILKGDAWKVTVAGTVKDPTPGIGQAEAVSVDTHLVALFDNPLQDEDKWARVDNFGGTPAGVWDENFQTTGLNNDFGTYDWQFEGDGTPFFGGGVTPFNFGVMLATDGYNPRYLYLARTTGLFTLDQLDECVWIMKTNSNLQTFLQIGLQRVGADQLDDNESVCFFTDVDSPAPLNFFARTEAAAGNITLVNTARIHRPNEYFRLRIKSEASSIRFFINDVEVANITTNIPTRTDMFYPRVRWMGGNDGLRKILEITKFYAKLK